MEKNILELKINNKNKDLETHLKPQWSWKTLFSIVLFCSILVFIIKDLEINFIKLASDSSKYFGDILSRILPPDFSNLDLLVYAMFETIEIAFLGTFIAIVFYLFLWIIFCKEILAPNYFVYIICKTIVIFFRAIPEFIIAMILVIAIGLELCSSSS